MTELDCKTHGCYKMNFQSLLRLIFWLLTLSLAACSATKSVPEGEYLYTGAKIDLGENKKIASKKLIDDLYSVLAPQPNARIAGLPLRLYMYQLFDNGKDKGLFPWVRDKIGQAPVLFREDYPEQVEKLMANRLFNNGYYDASVASAVQYGHKKAGVTYSLQLEAPYRIDSIRNQVTHPGIGPLIRSMPPSKVLRSGDIYTLAGLRAEAQRIETFLKERGYYFFSQAYLKFQVDSTNRDRTVDLRLQLREDAPQNDLKVAYIRSIDVWTDYGSERAAGTSKLQQEKVEGVKFINWTQPRKLRPEPLLSQVLLRPGDRYNVEYHHNTLKRLVNLSSLSFVNVIYNRPANSDSLEMEVMLSPRKPQTVQATFGLSYKNSQYLGPELELTYINRNLFRGSENLRVRGFTHLNFPVGNTVGNFYENTGLEVELGLPGLRIPWRRRQARDLTFARTKFNLKYERESTNFPVNDPIVVAVIDAIPLPELQEGLAQDSSYAPSIGLNSFKFTFGYQWQRRPDIFHELNPIGLGMQFDEEEVVELKELISVFLVLLQDFQSLVSLEDMIYWNPDYIFLYDSRNLGVKRHNYFYRGRLSVTGNQIFTDKDFEVLNVEAFESLFIQTENDFRYFYVTPKKKHTLAARFISNLSIPLGKELFLPFLDLYTVGGPNSVRAYSLRELGPGVLTPDDNQNSLWLFAGKGDLHLESSIEFRYKITNLFEVAAFADAGNVWLVKSSTEKANFKFDRFYKELGFGMGLGLRLNINPLVLRLDLAIPFTKPWLPEGQRWVANQIDVFSGAWRQENLAFNLSFGYPF